MLSCTHNFSLLGLSSVPLPGIFENYNYATGFGFVGNIYIRSQSAVAFVKWIFTMCLHHTRQQTFSKSGVLFQCQSIRGLVLDASIQHLNIVVYYGGKKQKRGKGDQVRVQLYPILPYKLYLRYIRHKGVIQRQRLQRTINP